LTAIRRVAFSASHDDARPNIRGVCVTGGAVVSTDGHRLTYATCERTGVADGARNVILSIDAIAHFPAGEAHSVAFTPKFMVVEFETGRACLSLVDGTFPDFRQVMPSLADMADMPTVVAERALLLGVVQRMGRGSNVKTKNVRLQFEGDESDATILASSACPDRGIEQTETLGVNAIRSNGVAKVGFNYEYVCDALKALDCDNVTVHYRDALSPAVFTNNDDVWCVVMPMRL
jgi:DNA polymerase III sliding clamp (beta) subunit (PCNA family)